MSSVPRVCSACGSASAWDARYCQRCGRPLTDGEEAPRYYGALSPGPTLVLGFVLVGAALLALVLGSVIAAIVLLALAVAAFVLFYETARRSPEHPVARRALSSGRHARGWATFARQSVAAWAKAIRDVLRLRRESRALRHEREPTLRALGEAAYSEDADLVTALRLRLHEIDDELADRDRAREEALARARSHVDEERAAATSTQQFSVEDITSGGSADESPDD